jgi:hypothetical protein
MADTKTIIQQLNPTPEEVAAYRRVQFESADRSYLNDRLNVPLPEGLHGEWIGRDDFSQYQAKSKGFVDGSDYLGEFNKLYESADGKSAVGDVTFMVIPKWMHIEQVKVAESFAARRSGINARDVDEAEKLQAESIGLGVEKSEKPTARVIDGAELNSILKG